MVGVRPRLAGSSDKAIRLKSTSLFFSGVQAGLREKPIDPLPAVRPVGLQAWVEEFVPPTLRPFPERDSLTGDPSYRRWPRSHWIAAGSP